MMLKFGAIFSIFLSCGVVASRADTVRVTVGDTGCVGRQQAVIGCWERTPGVTSVTVLPRQDHDPGAQRTFVIISRGAAPTTETLRAALGRREKRYPILDIKALEPPPVIKKGDGRSATSPAN